MVGTLWASLPLPLLQRMFLHAVAMGQRGYDFAICQGRWEPSAEQDLEVEPSTLELISTKATREEITEIYHDMYQLQRLHGKMFCDEEMEKYICQEILDSVKEHLWCRWVPRWLGEEPQWNPAGIPRLDCQADYSIRNHATYDRFGDVK